MSAGSFEITVAGRVQGVGFRMFAKDCADRLGLKGYVMNMDEEDKVKLEVEGNLRDVEALVSLLKAGPPSAAVRGVDVAHSNQHFKQSGFGIRV